MNKSNLGEVRGALALRSNPDGGEMRYRIAWRVAAVALLPLLGSAGEHGRPNQDPKRAPAGSATKELDSICQGFASALKQEVKGRKAVESRVSVGVLPFVFNEGAESSRVPKLGVDLANFAYERVREHLGEGTG